MNAKYNTQKENIRLIVKGEDKTDQIFSWKIIDDKIHIK